MTIGRFYSVEELGPNTGRSPEGFLVLLEVPISRTGIQLYGPDEVPSELEPSPNGTVTIERDPADVFSGESLASINGKPFVNDHPVENGERVDVTPQNWTKFAKGVAMNAHRGEGLADDLCFADIVVYDPETIDDILKKKKRQISLGYDATYDVIGPGHARQTELRINHIALVENGRCGALCTIRDEAPIFQVRKRRLIGSRHIHIHL
jgi:uncharacterized protein